MGAKEIKGGTPTADRSATASDGPTPKGETWRGGGAARKPACPPTGHGGKRRRRGIDRGPP